MNLPESFLIEKLGPLSDIEIVFLNLVLEHGFIVKSTWINLPIAQSMTSTAMAKVMWRLTNSRILTARPLIHGRNYFALSPVAAGKLRIRTSPKQPPLSSLIRCLARLIYFTELEMDAFKLETSQLARRLDGEPTYGLPPCFFGRLADPEFLGFLRVDGQLLNSRHRSAAIRNAQVLRHDVFRLVKFTRVRQLIKDKQFELTWITASQSRADAMLKYFRQYDHIGKAPIKTVVVPELKPFISPVGTTKETN